MNKKIIYIISSVLAIIVTIGIVLVVINSNNKNKIDETKDLYNLSELKFLNNVNTNEIFEFLDSGVNSELIGTYAFLNVKNPFYGTNSIIALKKDNTIVELATIQDEGWHLDVKYMFYSNGNLYYDVDDKRWSISLTEGNGNYIPKNYEFNNNYMLDWFYIIGNKFYSLSSSSYGLDICDLVTEECELQVIDIRQSLGIEIDNKKIGVGFDKVYVEDDKYIYILSEDKKNIYRIDINNPKVEDDLILASYEKVDKLGKNAHLLSETSKHEINGIKFDYEYNDSPNFFIEYNNKKYQLKEKNYRPITLLPNNYLMVEHYTDEESFIGEIEYINLKTGLKDENYSFDYSNDDIYFITK